MPYKNGTKIGVRRELKDSLAEYRLPNESWEAFLTRLIKTVFALDKKVKELEKELNFITR